VVVVVVVQGQPVNPARLGDVWATCSTSTLQLSSRHFLDPTWPGLCHAKRCTSTNRNLLSILSQVFLPAPSSRLSACAAGGTHSANKLNFQRLR
jgi:hypothetical protein